ncbi:dTDP-D-glucose 4,6-dehydratase [Bradyrhizobium sp. LB7.1]
MHPFADITKIKRILKWTPKVKFEDGVATMLKSMDQYKDAPLWTVDKIADATKDWFKYLGDDSDAASGTPQKASQ